MSYLDIHSHLIPGIDDGCEDFDQALESVIRLREAGYVGTVCTPHIWPELFPGNTPAHVQGLTLHLQRELRNRGVSYRLWPGGELRLFKGAVKWMKQHGVPTLAGSRCVLCDLWEDRWPKHADQTLDWLLDEGYTPILAHPERVNISEDAIEADLERITGKGVLLQGNFNCLTGQDGPLAAQRIRRWLRDHRYALSALDMHRPHLPGTRREGLDVLSREFTDDHVEALTAAAPRELLGLKTEADDGG
mgnify:CR=1 FL=1